MKKNLNQIDRFVRIIVSLLIGVLYVFGIIQGIVASVLIISAIIWTLTSCFSYCPMYQVLGLTTLKEPINHSKLSN